MEVLLDILGRSLLLILWGGGWCAILLGIGLLLAPAQVMRFNAHCSRWVDGEKLRLAPDRPLYTERFIYRHHRLAGSLLFCGSVYVLYKLMLDPRRPRSPGVSDPYGLFDAAVAVLVVFAVFGSTIGAVIATKPSLLRDIETAANKWIVFHESRREWAGPLLPLKGKIFTYGNTVGAFLLLCGIYVCRNLAPFVNSVW